jgi:hypothetical protein
MGTFTKSLSRELGKNTGKFFSNLIFGDKHSTPYRFIVKERQEQRIKARAYIENVRNERLLLREEIKRQKEYEKYVQEQELQERIEKNNKIVDEFNNYLNIIRKIHLDSKYNIDWREISTALPPVIVKSVGEMNDIFLTIVDKDLSKMKIEMIKSIDDKSKSKFVKIKSPFLNLFFRIFGNSLFFVLIIFAIIILFYYGLKFLIGLGIIIIFVIFFSIRSIQISYDNSKKKLNKFEKDYNHEKCKRINMLVSEHEKKYDDYLKELEEYNHKKALAQKVLSGDQETMSELLQEFNPFSDLNDYSASVDFEFIEKNILLSLYVNDNVVPFEKLILLRNGKEIKNVPMTKSEIFDIYQDFVCSCVLRIGVDIFGILPINDFTINVFRSIINKSIGVSEHQLILSVLFNREILNNLNLENIDPSDSMNNFVHNMNFKKLSGFLEVSELKS